METSENAILVLSDYMIRYCVLYVVVNAYYKMLYTLKELKNLLMSFLTYTGAPVRDYNNIWFCTQTILKYLTISTISTASFIPSFISNSHSSFLLNEYLMHITEILFEDWFSHKKVKCYILNLSILLIFEL